MSKKANKTIIGAFVVGSVALAVAGVLILGSGKFLTKRYPFVMYFEGSLKGLDVGAPVMFRGVKCGSVTGIVLRFDPGDLSVQIPVFIEMDPHRIARVRGGMDPLRYIGLLVERGMKAQLAIQSIVTGKLMIELDFHPDKPIELVGADPDYKEIPTIPSNLEEFARTIEKLPFAELVSKLTSAIEGIDRIVNSPEVEGSLRALNQSLNDIQTLVRNIDSRIDPLASSIEDAVEDYVKLAHDLDSHIEPLMSSITETVKDTQKLVRNVDRRIAPVQSSIDSTAKAATAALVQAEKTLRELEIVGGEDSPQIYQLRNTLKELSAAARSIRIWAEYLERHPEALIRGKGGSKGR